MSIKHPTPKQIAASNHNRLMGHTAMMHGHAFTIMNAPTVSDKGKHLALQIEGLVAELDVELRAVRIDP